LPEAAQTKMNNSDIKEFIRENRSLFWYIKEGAREEISIDLLIETILNYGNEKSVKRLFDLLGIKKVAETFYRQISGKRINYSPRTLHFFNLYFKKNA
jgi:hypothetical protein